MFHNCLKTIYFARDCGVVGTEEFLSWELCWPWEEPVPFGDLCASPVFTMMFSQRAGLPRTSSWLQGRLGAFPVAWMRHRKASSAPPPEAKWSHMGNCDLMCLTSSRSHIKSLLWTLTFVVVTQILLWKDFQSVSCTIKPAKSFFEQS